MSRKESILSDLTGLLVEDHVKISLRRKGHSIKIGSNYFTGDTVLDIDASELPGFLDSITFVKKEVSRSLLPSELPEAVKVTFFGQVGQSPTEQEKVPVVKPRVPSEFMCGMEHP